MGAESAGDRTAALANRQRLASPNRAIRLMNPLPWHKTCIDEDSRGEMSSSLLGISLTLDDGFYNLMSSESLTTRLSANVPLFSGDRCLVSSADRFARSHSQRGSLSISQRAVSRSR